MEPAGKLPQQELLTQNELLKQQVGQDTEPLGTGRELHVLNLHSKEPCVPGAAQQLGRCQCWGGGAWGPNSASSRHSSGRTTAMGHRASPHALGGSAVMGLLRGGVWPQPGTPTFFFPAR